MSGGNKSTPSKTGRPVRQRFRGGDLERANAALQQMIDALTRLESLDAFIPQALQIAARAFGAASAGYFEHPGETIYLRFWMEGEITYGPADLPGLDDKTHALHRRMAAGFTVPVEHLGCNFRTRTRPSILNHRTATASPELHALAYSRGWEIELNLPLIVNGVADGALTLYRKEDRPFTEDDIALGESLAKQIALAMQINRIAERERKTASASATADERQRAEIEREATQARLNESYGKVVRASTQSPRFEDICERVFFEITAAAGANGGQLFVYNPERNTLFSQAWISEHGQGSGPCPNSPPLLRAPFDADVTPAFRKIVEHRDVYFTEYAALSDEARGDIWPGLVEWHLSAGRKYSCAIPILAGDEPFGVVGLVWNEIVQFTPGQRDLLLGLTSQLGLVLRLKNLADSQQHAMVVKERARMAAEIHDTLAQGFTGTLLHLEALIVRARRGGRVSPEDLSSVRKIAAFGLSEARRSAIVIRPMELDRRDLPTALRQLTERSRVPGLLDAEYKTSGVPVPLAPAVEEAFLNVAHEAVNNAIRHADATRIEIRLCFEEGRVTLGVSDDGSGFDAAATRQRGLEFGLTSMRSRAESVGAEFEVKSQPGSGTSISASLPYV